MEQRLEVPEMGRRNRISGKVTVITAVFNAAATLSRCIDSVLSQDYRDLEYIVIDGASNDGSVGILEGYGDRILWRSEKDSGIYDAWNKALSLSTGEWIGFIGADDFFFPGAISSYMSVARQQQVDYISSLVRWVQPSGSFSVIGESWSWPRFQSFMTTAHVGSLHHSSLFQKYGSYDLSYRIVGDYEFLLRAQGELRTAFLEQITVEMQAGGTSDSFGALAEARRAKVATGGRKAAVASLEFRLAQAKLLVRRFSNRWVR